MTDTYAPTADDYLTALAPLDLPAGWETTVTVSTRRNVAVDIDEHAHLRITVPYFIPPADLARTIRRNLMWIHRKVREQAPYVPAHPVKEMVGGEGFPLFGTSHMLRIEGPGEQPFNVAEPLNLTPADPIRAARFGTWSGSSRGLYVLRGHATADTIIGWYTRTGQEWLSSRYDAVRRRMGVIDPCPIPTARVGNLKAREWGRYDRRTDTITLHWALFALDRELCEFVLTRELAKAAAAYGALSAGRKPTAAQLKKDAAARTARAVYNSADVARRLRRDGATAWLGATTPETMKGTA